MGSESVEPHIIDSEQVSLIIARLQKIRRQRLSSAGDDEDFIRVQERIETIISSLEAALQPGAPPFDVDQLARELAIVERLFESSGLVNVANVIRSVESSLRALGATPSTREPPAPQRYEPPVEALFDLQDKPEVPDNPEDEPPWPDEPEPPLLLPLLLFYGAGGACLAWAISHSISGLDEPTADLMLPILGTVAGALIAWLHRYNGPLFRGGQSAGGIVLRLLVVSWSLAGLAGLGVIMLGEAAPKQVPEPDPPPPEPVATATADPEPTAVTTIPEQPQAGDDDAMLKRVEEEIALADAALQDIDLQRAMQHFAAAAARDPHHRLVIEMAEKMVNALLDLSDEAAHQGDWDLAASRIEGARTIASRFYLNTDRINRVSRRHDTTDRFDDIQPDNLRAIQRAVGRSAKVTLTTSEVIKGRILKVNRTTLVLEMNTGVGGGQVHFTKEVPLRSIRRLRIFRK
jgi:hypothetical protein